ncbi:NAD(P)H-dependent oxidoreductase [Chryseobacterium shandongense]|uniref:NAD(P)H-dependent oxidoreductase n=1 Tax=Chryseobacterium shandongense TaxID=1493872 RepID=A0AAD0YAX2_9FLAO|nr:nitroreductase family protein [Chryseobacterium shandongense]AZA85484.1 NAD(P)H-dependent oxidoreductase [Chryseobacterium shandongense]AZA97591.1 NAD(P)H-dependent oxidoreductase [Chryseobacterium shandongense]
MNFLELTQRRYTTKKYNADKKIPADKINELKEILRLSASSINSQPWKFSFIENEAVKSELASVSYFNEQKINDASHLVVFSAVDNLQVFEEELLQNLPDGSRGYYNQFIKSLPESEIKSWLQHQVYLSLGFFLSASISLDLDSTPMEGIQSDRYKEILGLIDYKPLFAVALGYRNPDDANQPSINPKSRLPLEKIIQSL